MFPELSLGNGWNIPTAVLFVSLLSTFVLFYIYNRTQKYPQFETSTVLDLTMLLMVTGFIGARLMHVVYENPEYYFQNNNWPRMFYFWQGGFVFYGGFWLALLSGFIFVQIKKINFWQWADFLSVPMALAYGLGRISCLLAGCCYGKACEWPWAISLSWDQHHVLRHPTQIYALIWELSVWLLLLQIERKKDEQKWNPGMLFSIWIILHGAGRLIMEYFRDDFRGQIFLSLTISSWISLSLIVVGFSILQKKSNRT
jgi:phosphatidylglycerol:prolipoprotein diacylglycerol transferase